MCVCLYLSFKQQFHVLIWKHFKCDIISELKLTWCCVWKSLQLLDTLCTATKLGDFLEEHAVSIFSVMKVGGIMDLWITVHFYLVTPYYISQNSILQDTHSVSYNTQHVQCTSKGTHKQTFETTKNISWNHSLPLIQPSLWKMLKEAELQRDLLHSEHPQHFQLSLYLCPAIKMQI